jgi:hypothetical protein
MNSSISFSDGEKHVFEIDINLINEVEKFLKVKYKNIEYDPYRINGISFRIAVRMCNNGDAIYKFLD